MVLSCYNSIDVPRVSTISEKRLQLTAIQYKIDDKWDALYKRSLVALILVYENTVKTMPK